MLPTAFSRAGHDDRWRPGTGCIATHARIYTREGTCFVEDLDSTNGTFLNEERITPYLPYAFRDGDLLMFGTMRLKVHIYPNR